MTRGKLTITVKVRCNNPQCRRFRTVEVSHLDQAARMIESEFWRPRYCPRSKQQRWYCPTCAGNLEYDSVRDS